MDCSETKRRSLSQGLAVNPLSEAAAAFVRGTEPATREAPPLTPVEAPRPGGLAAITVRLPAGLVDALLRVSFERRLRRERPCAQQDIVAEALQAWLDRHEVAAAARPPSGFGADVP